MPLISRLNERRWVLGAAGIASVLALGVGTWAFAQSQSSLSSNDETVPTSSVLERQAVAGTDTPGKAIAAVVAGLDSSLLANVTVVKDTAPFGLHFELSGVTAINGGDLASVWQADLAQGAIAEHLVGTQSNLADVVGAPTLTFTGKNGTNSIPVGGAGDISPSQAFGTAGITDQEATKQIEVSLGEFGLTAVQVRIWHPLDRAAYVVASVPNAKALNGQFDALRQRLLGDPIAFEGLYLEVDLADGTPLVRASTAYRSGAGRLWIAPGMDDVVGAMHGSVPQG